MSRIRIWVLVFLFCMGSSSDLWAQNPRRLAQKANPSKLSGHVWKQGQNSVVSAKGTRGTRSTQCLRFDIEVGQDIRFNINCQGQKLHQNISTTKQKDLMVTQKGSHITITRYGYLVKEPQISQLKKTSLKIPFVEEMIHIKKQKNGELAFYFEKFRVDEFGRIVQDQLIQAHGLEPFSARTSASSSR